MSRKQWCVYEHVFPNGKRYIGQTCTDVKARWRDGKGYDAHPKIARAIRKYGWDNIAHNIIVENLTKPQADDIEIYLIKALNTIENGYNSTIGGDNITTTYLDPYLLDHMRSVRKWHKGYYDKELQEIYDRRFDADFSEFWNLICDGVTERFGIFSPTDEYKNSAFWFYFGDECARVSAYLEGKDISNWPEPCMAQAVEDRIFGCGANAGGTEAEAEGR